jgi:hypothetical protein
VANEFGRRFSFVVSYSSIGDSAGSWCASCGYLCECSSGMALLMHEITHYRVSFGMFPLLRERSLFNRSNDEANAFL